MPPHVPADPKKDDTPRDLTFNGLNGSTLRTQIHPNPHAIRFPEDLLQNNVSDPRTSIPNPKDSLFTRTTNTNSPLVSVAIAKTRRMLRFVTIRCGSNPLVVPVLGAASLWRLHSFSACSTISDKIM